MSDVISIPATQTAGAAAQTPSATLPVPTPRLPITIRPGTLADLPFIDRLQRAHSYMVGWMPRKQVEEKIAAGHVLVAENSAEVKVLSAEAGRKESGRSPGTFTEHSALSTRHSSPVGYIISQDQYMKRDDLGVVYQVNVDPMQQRHLVGAVLVRAALERAAYGCRLFCCWCAQDIRANYFWESLGFRALAFRTGARGQQRTHIFWQRRVRADDATTPYWFPVETNGGAMREGRIVLPIPHDMHWRDTMPLLLPAIQSPAADITQRTKALPAARAKAAPVTTARAIAVVRSQSRHLGGIPPGKAAVMTSRGMKYVDRADAEPPAPPTTRPKRQPRQTLKNDPKQLSAARELRDRWLEQVNAMKVIDGGKYNVGRCLEVARAVGEKSTAMRALLAVA